MSKNDAIWVEGERELFLKMQRMTNFAYAGSASQE